MMQLLHKAKEYGIEGVHTLPDIHCKAFEDNLGAYEMARLPKLRPQTKHLNITLHHFWSFVEKGLINLVSVRTNNQLEGLYSKPLGEVLFLNFRKCIMGW